MFFSFHFHVLLPVSQRGELSIYNVDINIERAPSSLGYHAVASKKVATISVELIEGAIKCCEDRPVQHSADARCAREWYD